MKYKITMIEKKTHTGNPFLKGLINDVSRVRTCEIEAESEQAVRDFFDEAQRECYPSVAGFELSRIDLV